MGLGEQHPLGRQVPVVQEMSHDQHLGGGHPIGEEVAGPEHDALAQTIRLHEFRKEGLDLRQIGPDAHRMRMGPRKHHWQAALGATDVADAIGTVPPA